MSTVKVVLVDGGVFLFDKCEYFVSADRTAFIYKPTYSAASEGHIPNCVATYNRDAWKSLEVMEDKAE